MRLVVVTPARDEAGHLRAVAESITGQRRRPDQWVIVDDGSRDETLELARQLERELDFVRALQAPRSGEAADPLAAAAEARAFNWALREVDGSSYDYVGKLDADIVLAPEHFERLLAEFEADPRLGVAGCRLDELHGGRWVLNRIPDYHVHGAVKIYRRECFEQIGGLPERLGWDTIDETYARMRGWRTHSFGDLRGRHLRASATAGGVLRGRARHGECAWIVSYPPELVLARGVRMLASPPYIAGGLAFLSGWLRAAVRRRQRVEDPMFRRFSRDEQRRRIRSMLRRRVRR